MKFVQFITSKFTEKFMKRKIKTREEKEEIQQFRFENFPAKNCEISLQNEIANERVYLLLNCFVILPLVVEIK